MEPPDIAGGMLRSRRNDRCNTSKRLRRDASCWPPFIPIPRRSAERQLHVDASVDAGEQGRRQHGIRSYLVADAPEQRFELEPRSAASLARLHVMQELSGAGIPVGVMAAPIYQVNPTMGADLIIVVFAVVVIGGMGSILGAILTGFGLGLIEGLTKVFYPEASNVVIFVIMTIVLLIKPAGLFGTQK